MAVLGGARSLGACVMPAPGCVSCRSSAPAELLHAERPGSVCFRLRLFEPDWRDITLKELEPLDSENTDPMPDQLT